MRCISLRHNTDIHCFTNDYPDVQVIVTSRIIGYVLKVKRSPLFLMGN
ncbi:hypothetical protein [uncultured Nostoc sp.]